MAAPSGGERVGRGAGSAGRRATSLLLGLGILSAPALLAVASCRSQSAPAPELVSDQVVPETPTLTVGSPLENRLGPGESHSYALDLAPNAYLRVVADQTGGDIALSLSPSGGSPLKEADASDRPWVPELLSLVIPDGGEYLLGVFARGEGNASYRVTLEEARPAVPSDGERVLAEDAFQEGQRLVALSVAETQRAAITAFEQASDRWRAIGDRAGLGRALHEIGSIQVDLGDGSTALATLQEALDARREGGDQAGVVRTLTSLATSLTQLGRSDQAELRGLEALELSRKLDDSRLTALSLNSLGFLAFRTGQFSRAAELFGQALSLYRESGDRWEIAVALDNLAASQRNLGHVGEAVRLNREALELAKLQGERTTEAAALQNLGILHKARGELQAALEAHTLALELAVKIGRRNVEASAAASLGDLYSTLGDHDRALAYLERALTANRAMGSLSGEARDLMSIAYVLRRAGRIAEARTTFEKALAASRETGEQKTEAYALGGLGRLHLDLETPEMAVGFLEQALALQTEDEGRPARMQTLSDLGDAYLRLGSHELAYRTYRDALALAGEIGDRIREVAPRIGLARLERLNGNLDEARRQLEAGVTVVESMRTRVLSPDLRASFFARSHEDYVLLADILIEMALLYPGTGYDRQAFEVSERARARSLVELLTEAQIEVREGIAPAHAEQEKELDGRLWLIQNDLTRELARAVANPERIDSLRSRLAEARAAREELEWRIRREHPRYAEIRYPQPLEQPAVQALIDPHTALLEYLLGPERSFLFVATSDDLGVYVLPPREEIAALVRDARAGLETPDRRRFGSFQLAANRLFGTLVAPAWNRLEGKSHLIVAPDAELNLLPFEALIELPPPARPVYLVERWAVSYAPSASTLASLQANAPAALPAKTLLAFGDPLLPGVAGETPVETPATRGLAERTTWRWRRLPGSRREVMAVAALYGSDHAAVFLGADASERNLETTPLLQSAGVLHLASHAIVDEHQPAYSALLLSRQPEDREDGLLEAHEIFNLRLGADLVILSACETALGKDVRGEGLVGLTRAFLYAGARSVAVSLWPVADNSTAELMVAFHQELIKDGDRSEALRRAKLESLKTSRWRHPYYWAPFVLVGAPR